MVIAHHIELSSQIFEKLVQSTLKILIHGCFVCLINPVKEVKVSDLDDG